MNCAMERRVLLSERGFSIIELSIILMILSILVAIGGYNYQQWMTRNSIEGQIRKMQTDLMQARMRAMERKRMYFAVIQAASYQIAEDTNMNETLDASPGDTYQSSVPLTYRSAWTGTLVFNTNGQIATSPATTVLSIPINNLSTGPEYDCILVYPSRLSIGSMHGGSCVAK